MRPLTDYSCFSGHDDVIPYYINGRSVYRNTPHRKVLLYLANSTEKEDGIMFSVRLLCRAMTDKGDWHRREYPHFLCVTLVESGECHIRVNTETCTAEAGDLFFLPPGAITEYASNGKCGKSALLIDGEGVSFFQNKFPLCRHLNNEEIFKKCFNGIATELAHPERVVSRLRISQYCFELLQYCSVPEMPALPLKLRQALTLLEDSFQKSLSVPELAEHCGISPSALNRLFRAYLQTTPYQYLIQLRMKHATHLLENHLYSIKEIAYKCGFSNPLNFSTEFKKYKGCSPREYARSFQPENI